MLEVQTLFGKKGLMIEIAIGVSDIGFKKNDGSLCLWLFVVGWKTKMFQAHHKH